MRLLVATLGLAAFVAAGCGGDDPFAPKQRNVNAGALGVVGSVDELAAEPADDTAEEKAPKKAAAPPATTLKKAEVGVGKKGHYGGPGIYKTPVSVYFRAQERITFNIDIPRHMNLYKALMRIDFAYTLSP